jgi:hypothetical protein
MFSPRQISKSFIQHVSDMDCYLFNIGLIKLIFFLTWFRLQFSTPSSIIIILPPESQRGVSDKKQKK